MTLAELTTIQSELATENPFATTLNLDAFQAMTLCTDINISVARNDVVREEVLLEKAQSYFGPE